MRAFGATILVVAAVSCRGRLPEAPVDAGVVVVDAGPPPFDVAGSEGASPGTCIEGRWLLHDRDRRDDDRPLLVDCAAFGASCEPGFRGCVARAGEPCDPRGVCRIDAHVDDCDDFTCPDAPSDTNAFDVPVAITLPTTLVSLHEYTGDRDCFTFENDAEGLVAFSGLLQLPVPIIVDAAPRPTLQWGGGLLTTVPAGVAKFCMAGSIRGGDARRLEIRRVGLDELETLENTGGPAPSGQLCLGDTSVSVTSAGTVVASRCRHGCASMTGRCITSPQCESHADCPGSCERTTTGTGVCGPPIDPRVIDTCVDGRFIGNDAVVQCNGECVHGVGCVGVPGDVCAFATDGCEGSDGVRRPCIGPGFCVDGEGGLVPCVDGRCPDLTDDDAPGYYAPARTVMPTAPVVLRPDGPGDVDCVRVVEDEAPTWTATLTGGGRLEQRQRPLIDGDVVRWQTKLCVSGHGADATLTFAPSSEP